MTAGSIEVRITHCSVHFALPGGGDEGARRLTGSKPEAIVLARQVSWE